MKLIEKYKYTGVMELITGLHIGDSKENVQIGGLDNTVIRRKDNNQPYIPGSSLKGKIRCLLEQADGENANSRFTDTTTVIGKLFGSTENASRIIVRDAYMTEESEKALNASSFMDLPYSEVKFENTIDRIKGKAKDGGIRQVERVPAGAKFNVNFIINIFEGEEKEALLSTFKRGIKLLELDFLGGSGSRGYGQIKFSELTEEAVPITKL